MDIENFPEQTYVKQTNGEESDNTRCMVCLADYEEGDRLRTLQCFHKFHTECIDNWLSRKPICPICK